MVAGSRRAAAADVAIVLTIVVALAVVPYAWAAGAPHRIAALWSRWYLLVVVTCLAFGAAHFAQGPAGMADTAAIGVVLAVIVVRTQPPGPPSPRMASSTR